MSDKLNDEQIVKLAEQFGAWSNHGYMKMGEKRLVAFARALLAASPAPAISESEDAAPSFASPLTPFGQLVRSLRVVTGTLLGDMARAMGVSSAELSAIEFGRRPITPEKVKAISDFFENYGLPRTAPLLQGALDAARKGEKS
ncbi:helix-turn-helix domain-containing protein [Burkholderia glumae]|uniref:helix-turn-helix domain-containing protein n=1 Tax=Burkholderia glumae TaxID=337 RepID=UPI0021512957|nr:helix-turn-helix transcriptional regulator [Burkholderia glumae]